MGLRIHDLINTRQLLAFYTAAKFQLRIEHFYCESYSIQIGRLEVYLFQGEINLMEAFASTKTNL